MNALAPRPAFVGHPLWIVLTLIAIPSPDVPTWLLWTARILITWIVASVIAGVIWCLWFKAFGHKYDDE